jgi:uncharacterized protein YggE
MFNHIRFSALKISLFVVVMFSSQLSFAQSGEKNFIDQNYIEVVGTAELEIVPNLIYIGVIISEKDNKNKTLLQEQEKQLTTKLNEIGIDISKDLLVKDMSSGFKTSLLAKTDVLLSKEYQIIVRDTKNVNKIFIELEKVGISNISIERLDHTDIINYRKQVKINAIKAAKDKASSLAIAIDQTIGRAIFIQEKDNTIRPYANANTIGAVGAVHRGYTADEFKLEIVEFEKIKLEYSVLCRFELK